MLTTCTSVEVKANTNGDGRADCSISASPAGESAFTEFKEWQSCAIGAENTFSFPDAPGRPNVGNIKVQWTEDGGPKGDGFWTPEIGFMDLSPPVWFSPEEGKSILQTNALRNKFLTRVIRSPKAGQRYLRPEHRRRQLV